MVLVIRAYVIVRTRTGPYNRAGAESVPGGSGSGV